MLKSKMQWRDYIHLTKKERKRFPRTREKGYADYGLSYEDVITLKNICRNADDNQIDLLKASAEESCSEIASEMIVSLCCAKSYIKLIRQGFKIPYSANDFYSYRRKTLAIFYAKLKNVCSISLKLHDKIKT